MQTKTDHLALVVEKTGLRISHEKTKVMWANNKQREKIKLKDVELEDAHSFKYLGSIITSDRGVNERAG